MEKYNYDLSGKVCLVTGGSRGIGRAAAVGLAKCGADVAVAARTREDLMDTVDLIENEGVRVLPLRVDLADPEKPLYVVSKILREFGCLDVLINSAGTLGALEYLTDVSEKEWDRVMAVNVKAPFMLSQAAARHMMSKRYGRIVNMVSGLGWKPLPRFGAYSVSKAGLIQMTRILALELKDFGITVNGIDPGQVDTTMQEEVRLAFRDEGEGKAKPKQELKTPETVVPAILYLASESSGETTGEIGNIEHFLDKR